MPKRKPVKNRTNILNPIEQHPNITLAGVEKMLGWISEIAHFEKISCTVNRYCHTRIFKLSETTCSESLPNCVVYNSNSVEASLVYDLEEYFNRSSILHYSINPTLQHDVAVEQKKENPDPKICTLYLVVEEIREIKSKRIDRGCFLVDEVGFEDGRPFPILLGGRQNEKFILLAEASDSPLPELPHDEKTINLILTAVRAVHDTVGAIPILVDQKCLVSQNNHFVSLMFSPKVRAHANVVQTLNLKEYKEMIVDLRQTLSSMESELSSDYIKLLVNAMYWDDAKDDDFRQLHYLSLWQSLSECARKLGYRLPNNRKIAGDQTVIAGGSSLQELTTHRHAIAHNSVVELDGKYMIDLYRTINELIRRKYAPKTP